MVSLQDCENIYIISIMDQIAMFSTGMYGIEGYGRGRGRLHAPHHVLKSSENQKPSPLGRTKASRLIMASGRGDFRVILFVDKLHDRVLKSNTNCCNKEKKLQRTKYALREVRPSRGFWLKVGGLQKAALSSSGMKNISVLHLACESFSFSSCAWYKPQDCALLQQ